jgi:PKD repeat protein
MGVTVAIPKRVRRDGRRLFAAALVVAAAAVSRPVAARAQRQPQSQQTPASASAMNSEPSEPGHLKLPQLPSITMTAVPSYGPEPLTVGFFANGIDPAGQGFVSYLWTFGDGQVSMAPPMMFFHTYSKPGTYIATVTATTADGRTATSYVGITVRPRTD